jgi:hypothetical protein
MPSTPEMPMPTIQIKNTGSKQTELGIAGIVMVQELPTITSDFNVTHQSSLQAIPLMSISTAAGIYSKVYTTYTYALDLNGYSATKNTRPYLQQVTVPGMQPGQGSMYTFSLIVPANAPKGTFKIMFFSSTQTRMPRKPGQEISFNTEPMPVQTFSVTIK